MALRALISTMLPQREEIATIVVCEDDDATLDLLCDHLTADRFEVLPAPSAADALRLCRYNHPDATYLRRGAYPCGFLGRERSYNDGLVSRPLVSATARVADPRRDP